MELYEFLSYTRLINWLPLILGACLFLLIITKTKYGISYRENILGTHFRVGGLILLVICLLYSSFIVDKTQLTNDADTKRVSLESDISLLESIIPSANEKYQSLVLTIGELHSMTSGDYDKGKIYSYLSETESKIRSLNDLVDVAKSRILTQSYSGRGYFSTTLGESNPDSIISEINKLDQQLTRIREIKKVLEVVYSSNLRELKVVTVKYEHQQKSNHSENIYYAIRALSLGALGALITLLASYVLVEPNNGQRISFIKSEHYWPLVLGHTLMGAVISIVAFGLFYSKQLTIFQPEATSKATVPPEYWRITILCVIAGAFAEKLYSAVANRVDKYVEEPKPNKQINKDT